MRNERAQRLLDVVLAALGLFILSPILAAIASAIVLDGGRPIIFRQARVGRHGRDFTMLKFRSMVFDPEGLGPMLTIGRDPRITRIGRLLRQLKLDELPQLVNVLAGDMSLVGPRPEVRRYVELYTTDQCRVLELRPGITDPASLAYYDESTLLARASDPEASYIADIMPQKIAMNLAYAARASIASDVAVIVRTVLHPLLARRSRDTDHKSRTGPQRVTSDRSIFLAKAPRSHT